MYDQNSPRHRSWSDRDTAVAYGRFAEKHNLYKVLASDLLSRLDFSVASHVLDVACGTGIVGRLLRDNFKYSGRITGIDSSGAMLEVARAKSDGYGIDYKRTAVEEVVGDIMNVDVAICSAALWQMQCERTFVTLRRCLTRGGRFAFNYPLTWTLPGSPGESLLVALAAAGYSTDYEGEMHYLPSLEESQEFFRIPLFAEGSGLAVHGVSWISTIVRTD